MKSIYLKPEEIIFELNCSKGIVDTYDSNIIQASKDVAKASADNAVRVIIKELDPYIKQVVECDKFKDGDALIDPVGLATLDYYWEELKKRLNE